MPGAGWVTSRTQIRSEPARRGRRERGATRDAVAAAERPGNFGPRHELEGVPDLRSDPLTAGIASEDMQTGPRDLDPTDRALIALRYVAELSSDEIGALSGCRRPAPAVVSRACSDASVGNLAMNDFDPFERRFAAALRSEADLSVPGFEAASIARAAIDGGKALSFVRRLGIVRTPARPRTGVAYLLVVLALVTAFLAAAIAGGALRSGPQN